MGIEPLKSLANFESEYFVNVSSELVYIVPPTSIWTGAVYRDAAATHGIPVIGLWLVWINVLGPDGVATVCDMPPTGKGKGVVVGVVGVGDDELEIVGETVGDELWKCGKK